MTTPTSTDEILENKAQLHFPNKTRDSVYAAWTRVDRMEKFIKKFKGPKTESVRGDLKEAKMHLERCNDVLANVLVPWAGMLKNERKK